MKNLKFRIWDNDKKGFHFLNGIWNMPDPCYDAEIQMWTGLLDRHGKEIYEGDILKVNWCFEDYLIEINKLNESFVVEFRYYSWFPFSHILPTPEDIEIIGNIYLKQPHNKGG